MSEYSQKWKDNRLMKTRKPFDGTECFLNTNIPRSEISVVIFRDHSDKIPFFARVWTVGSGVKVWAVRSEKLYRVCICAEGGINAAGACEYLFSKCRNLREVQFNSCFHITDENNAADLPETDDAEGQDKFSLKGMFSECELLESLDISDWDTSLIQNMACMFKYCTSLSSLDISRWNTGCVRSMSHMFCGCKSLESIDISCWNTERVRSMASMFCLCERLKTLDISRWKTGQVRDMESMFYCCLSLESLDISGWDTGMVENISRMFWHCTSLSSLDLSGWNTSRVEKMCGTFCMNETEWHSGLISENNLVSLDVSGWDTSNVRKMPWLFRGCNFSSIDLSSWDTGKVEDMTAKWGILNSEGNLSCPYRWEWIGDFHRREE